METLRVPLDRFRIPPVELEEMLPQQLLMLMVAAAALEDTRTSSQDATRTGVLIGLGLDPNTTNFHIRWADGANTPGGYPALTANRVMGALGSIAASRIARAFHCGGPSFTICSEEASSARAVEVAVRALRQGEIDRAVVGGVDFAGDPRSQLASHEVGLGASRIADGAAAVVLKRYDDAVRDGDRIYAVIRGVGSASGASRSATVASALLRALTEAGIDPSRFDHLESTLGPAEQEAIAAVRYATRRSTQFEVGTLVDRLGHTGFATGAVQLVATALALYHDIQPPTQRTSAAAFWLKNQDPRRAGISTLSMDGTSTAILLEENPTKADDDATRDQPLGARPEGVFAIEGKTPGELLDGLNRLRTWLPSSPRNIEAVARDWLRRVPLDSKKALAVALVPRSLEELGEQIREISQHLRQQPEKPFPAAETDQRPNVRDRVF
ncbi:MAG: polyketide synthase, partial [Gemmataceae bacterium]